MRLPRDEFYIPTDMDALRMENELLSFEVRFLKTQLSAREEEAERSVAQLQSHLEESEHSAARLRNRLAEAERAEQDLVVLLRHMANRPFGWYFGLKRNFRTLEERNLGTDA
jgi:hypothetical protein